MEDEEPLRDHVAQFHRRFRDEMFQHLLRQLELADTAGTFRQGGRERHVHDEKRCRQAVLGREIFHQTLYADSHVAGISRGVFLFNRHKRHGCARLLQNLHEFLRRIVPDQFPNQLFRYHFGCTLFSAPVVKDPTRRRGKRKRDEPQPMSQPGIAKRPVKNIKIRHATCVAHAAHPTYSALYRKFWRFRLRPNTQDCVRATGVWCVSAAPLDWRGTARAVSVSYQRCPPRFCPPSRVRIL